MRKKLRQARQNAGLTQKAVADRLGISLRFYKYIEKGSFIGNVELWDALEDMFGIHQRKLREISSEPQTSEPK